jgi:hypothetical protein
MASGGAGRQRRQKQRRRKKKNDGVLGLIKESPVQLKGARGRGGDHRCDWKLAKGHDSSPAPMPRGARPPLAENCSTPPNFQIQTVFAKLLSKSCSNLKNSQNMKSS